MVVFVEAAGRAHRRSVPLDLLAPTALLPHRLCVLPTGVPRAQPSLRRRAVHALHAGLRLRSLRHVVIPHGVPARRHAVVRDVHSRESDSHGDSDLQAAAGEVRQGHRGGE